MLEKSTTFGGVSSDDIPGCAALGLTVADSMGGLDVELPDGKHLFVYPKRDHQPATYTFLNFKVDDIEAAVDELRAKGVETKIYSDDDFPTDARGIARGHGHGPDIAWFRDPAGNVIAVLADSEPAS
jgi:catechol 2,3-dioxygenase-like lactoylglutathione lyase family enzyme